MKPQTKTTTKPARELQPGDRIETSAGFITVTEVRVWSDGCVEVIYPSLSEMLTVQSVIENGQPHVNVAIE